MEQYNWTFCTNGARLKCAGRRSKQWRGGGVKVFIKIRHVIHTLRTSNSKTKISYNCWIRNLTAPLQGQRVHSSTSWPFLRHVHSPVESLFCTQCDLALLLSITSIKSFTKGHQVAAYVFFFLFPSLQSFPISFLQFRSLEGSSYASCFQFC